MTTTATWDAEHYDRSFGYVSVLARGVVDVLAPRPGERILDLGCGTGELTAVVAAASAEVEGIDADAAMIAKARDDHPSLRFEVADAHGFEVDRPIDAVFSNAALHWMLRPDEVIARVHAALRPGGRFVAEFGGQGNVAIIHRAVLAACTAVGVDPGRLEDPWYFPSPGEHAARLEAGGLRVRSLELIDRPTRLSDDGVDGWIRMFGGRILDGVPPAQRNEVIRLGEEICRPELFRDGHWYADYVRLRFVAERVSSWRTSGTSTSMPPTRSCSSMRSPPSNASGQCASRCRLPTPSYCCTGCGSSRASRRRMPSTGGGKPTTAGRRPTPTAAAGASPESPR